MNNKVLKNSALVLIMTTLGACGYAQDFAHTLTPAQQEDSAIEYYAAPVFPEAAAKSCEAGAVLVQYDVGYNGEVKPESVRVIADAGSPALADAAVSAVRRWKYAPAMEGNSIIERTGLQTAVNFEIEGCDPATVASNE
ncbi:MAG: energy transducer TonB [Pseudomonadota bacterium]